MADKIIKKTNIKKKSTNKKVKVQEDTKVIGSQDGVLIVGDQPNTKPKVNLIKSINNPALGYTYGYGRDSFMPSEYDLSEIGRIEDVENIVRQAFKKKLGLMFKAGYDFAGPNKNTVRYIKERFTQIQKASGIPTQVFLRTVGSDLIRLSNAFVVKSRNLKASGGKRRRDAQYGNVDPIAAYFVLPAETVEIRRNADTGKVVEYRQKMPDGRYKDFPAKNVIHMFYDKRPGFNIGKPTIVPVVDDIRALRRIEQNIELLIYQHLFPLFHHKVGTKEQPDKVYADGTREVDDVRDQIQYMPSEGSIVTSYRHEIDAIGAESRAIRAEGYLEHFKKRVIAGLGISSVDLGEGDTATRTTSESMSRSMIDDVKDFQTTLMTFFDEFIIKELLLESTFPEQTLLDEDNIVSIVFKEIDVDAKIKAENHFINLYAGHGITETEFRIGMGREPLTDVNRGDTFFERIMIPQLELKSMGGFGNGDGLNGAQKSAKAVVQPSNQHGKKTGPEKRKSSYRPANAVAVQDNVLKNEFKDILSDIDSQIDLGMFSTDWAVQLLRMAETRILERLKNSMKKSLRKGVREYANIVNVELGFPYMRLDDYATYRVDRVMAAAILIIHKLTVGDPDIKERANKIYESLGFRFDFILRTETRRSYLYGIALAHKSNGTEKLSIELSEDACIKCKRSNPGTIDLNNLVIEDLPVFHDNCGCGFNVK